ncbi:hypothetical protein ABMA28_007646 [Loxostege sticticalis]|uniref:Uncharacterized protein n=1 Tax=Loxostege sticticalis TaxID=481309 RepID=A0ABD0SI79_LOXSC
MALKLWIVALALVVVAVQGHVLKSQKVELDGMTVEVIIRPTSEKMNHQPEEAKKRVDRRTHDVVVPAVAAVTPNINPKDVKVDIEDRFGIRSGNCPVGYVQRGGFCFPDYD